MARLNAADRREIRAMLERAQVEIEGRSSLLSAIQMTCDCDSCQKRSSGKSAALVTDGLVVELECLFTNPSASYADLFPGVPQNDVPNERDIEQELRVAYQKVTTSSNPSSVAAVAQGVGPVRMKSLIQELSRV